MAGEVRCVVGIDPGTHTGVAVWVSGIVNDPVKQSRQWLSEMPSAVVEREAVVVPALEWLKGILPVSSGGVGVLCVIEDFGIRGKVDSSAREGLSACRIGPMFLCEVLRAFPLAKVEFQQPSLMSNLTNDRLRRLGLWVPDSVAEGREWGMGPDMEHRRDAWRHVVVALRKRGMRVSE